MSLPQVSDPTTLEQLRSALDAFRAALASPDLLRIFESTTCSDLDTFLQRQDETRQPSLNLMLSLSAIKNLFTITYEAGCQTCGLEEDVLSRLYGMMRCVLLAGHNKYNDMPEIAKLLEEIGRGVQYGDFGQSEGHGSTELWGCTSLISAEIIRLCEVYIQQGLSSAKAHADSITLYRVSDTLNVYRDARNQSSIIASIAAARRDNTLREIFLWLSPPDPSSNFNASIKQRQPHTGLWLLEKSQFVRWKTRQRSLLWLYGKPGCGKTMLCSTVVEHMLQHCEAHTTLAVAYFYFSFSDIEKQSCTNMIRSVVAQLSAQCKTSFKALSDLFSACANGQREPSDDEVMKVLQQLINKFDQTYIILDALDECKEREGLFQSLGEILEWRLGTLHVIVTSRPETDIKENLENWLDQDEKICIQSALVNDDICTYVQHRIQNDTQLKRWRGRPDVQEEIKTSLMERVDGMFQWAACQLDALSRCYNLPRLRTALASLPRTLDQTYERILCNIDPDYRYEVLKILQWLVYSARPLRIQEMVEVLAVETNEEPRFDPQRRFPEAYDILSICPSLITTAIATHKVPGFGEIEVEELRLAHFSVEEYLVSDRVSENAKLFRVQEKPSHANISDTCLSYLLHFENMDDFTTAMLQEFSLAQYSAEYWMHHARISQERESKVLLALELFQQSNAYLNWLRLCNPDRPWEGPQLTKRLADVTNPLYYASLTGLYQQSKQLIEKGADVNVQGGGYGTALQAASIDGHEAIVMLLLKKGADINAQGGLYGTALQAASINGHEAVVMLLLKKGADVNAQGEEYCNALQAASINGHEPIIKLLLKKGANVNAQGGKYGNALQAASINGHEPIIKLLLEKGADVNAQGGEYGNALQAASARGHEAVVMLLLESGADVNAQGGWCGNALQAASINGHKAIVMLLLKKGADVNAQGGEYGNALQAASIDGHKAIVMLLLKKGADVNAQGGEYSNALQAASIDGHKAIVMLLLEKGADVNAQGGEYGNALQAASINGHEAVVMLLLERGANVNAQGGEYGNALQAALIYEHEAVVMLLLEKGVDVNAQGGYYGNALQAASAKGHEAVVMLLLEKGADINAQGGLYGNALQAASINGHKAIVMLLLERGANVNAQGGEYGNALQAASIGGHEAIVKLLLEKEADVNAQGGYHSTALQAALAMGNEAIVTLLLAKGANNNA